jgi:uncharacterized protein (DUF1684 family)
MCYNTPMKIPISSTPLVSIVAALLICLAACAQPPEPTDPAYIAEVEEWRSARLERLTADDGWLTLTGLYWLGRGHNAFGSGEQNPVVLPDASLPTVAGSIVVGDDGVVIVTAEQMAKVFVDGRVISEAVLKTDADGTPDIVTVGRVQFHIIDREGRLAARVKDPKAPALTNFTGIDHFPIDEAYRVEARLEPYDSPREVAVPTELGQDATYVSPGLLRFSIGGSEQALQPYFSGPENGRYFLIFRDATSGMTTYGAGRFLYASAAGEDGTTVLDFNLAFNPPCAFTPYATCPLAPPQNWLQASIEAGEKYSGEAH